MGGFMLGVSKKNQEAFARKIPKYNNFMRIMFEQTARFKHEFNEMGLKYENEKVSNLDDIKFFLVQSFLVPRLFLDENSIARLKEKILLAIKEHIIFQVENTEKLKRNVNIIKDKDFINYLSQIIKDVFDDKELEKRLQQYCGQYFKSLPCTRSSDKGNVDSAIMSIMNMKILRQVDAKVDQQKLAYIKQNVEISNAFQIPDSKVASNFSKIIRVKVILIIVALAGVYCIKNYKELDLTWNLILGLLIGVGLFDLFQNMSTIMDVNYTNWSNAFLDATIFLTDKLFNVELIKNPRNYIPYSATTPALLAPGRQEESEPVLKIKISLIPLTEDASPTPSEPSRLTGHHYRRYASSSSSALSIRAAANDKAQDLKSSPPANPVLNKEELAQYGEHLCTKEEKGIKTYVLLDEEHNIPSDHVRNVKTAGANDKNIVFDATLHRFKLRLPNQDSRLFEKMRVIIDDKTRIVILGSYVSRAHDSRYRNLQSSLPSLEVVDERASAATATSVVRPSP
jgi:hypothetical protein